MGITELVRNAKYEEGYREGLKEGRVEGAQLYLPILNLIKEGKSVEYICKKMNVSENIVNRVIANIPKNK